MSKAIEDYFTTEQRDIITQLVENNQLGDAVRYMEKQDIPFPRAKKYMEVVLLATSAIREEKMQTKAAKKVAEVVAGWLE